MPTYEYVCDACKAEFERVQRFADDPIRECPSCGAAKARRRISAAGIVFKGSGWYLHDSKRGATGKAAPASKDKGDDAAAASNADDKAAPTSAPASDSAPKAAEGAPAGDASAKPAVSAPAPTSGTSSPTERSAP